MPRPLTLTSLLLALSACGGANGGRCPIGPCPLDSQAAPKSVYDQGPAKEIAPDPRERHLKRLQQLTFGGQNAEAYFSFEGDRIIFQSTRGDLKADQIFSMRLDASELKLLSNGQGKTTCGYFFPGAARIVYASTFAASPLAPPPPDYAKYGYHWKFQEGFDIYSADADGSHLKRLTETPGYDAECTISPDGEWIVFTSIRDGDLELYKMRKDGSEVTRLTHELGYDGGAFFTADGKQIVYRGYTPTTPADEEQYKTMMKENMWRPGPLDLRVMDADGSHKRTLLHNGATNWAPFPLSDGRRVVFSSNVHDPNPKSRNFDLYIINLDGSGLDRITFDEEFDGFPMFSPDCRKLLWAANRHGSVPHETNLFLADWQE